MNLLNFTLPVLTFFIAISCGILFVNFQNLQQKKLLNAKVNKQLTLAKKKAALIVEEADEYKIKISRKIQSLVSSSQENTVLLEKRIALKEGTLKKRNQKIEEKENAVLLNEQDINGLKVNIAQSREVLEDALTKKAKLSVGEAKETLFSGLESDFAAYFELSGNRYVENCKDNANKEAIHHLKSVMQKYSEPSSVDHLDKTIKVPKDITKGRLIGRGAKNLVYLEEQTGADIIFEDQEGVITVSCFNLVIQETVKNAIIKLMKLDKIDFEAIDNALIQSRKELDLKLEKIGSEAAEIIGLKQTDPELMILIGRLKYRTSYGQNILYHSLEIAYFSAHLASEIGADVEVAKIGGFLHDIGKAIDQEVNGSHDYLGKEIMEKFGFSWEEVHAAWTHHDAIPIETVEAQIVKAADAISAGRPGARTESAQMYIERIQGLEKIALNTSGVKKAFALSAGREIRTIIDETKVTDQQMEEIAQKMASEIEENLAYPGKIKVNLIRTLESIDYANRGVKPNNTTT